MSLTLNAARLWTLVLTFALIAGAVTAMQDSTLSDTTRTTYAMLPAL